MSYNTSFSIIRKMTSYERLLWRLHVWFGYFAYKSMFGKVFAVKWKQDMLDIIEEYKPGCLDVKN